MDTISLVIFFLQLPILFFLIQPIFQVVLFGLKEALNKTLVQSDQAKKYHFALIVTAYKDTELIPPLIDSVLRNTYDHYTLYIVADRCDTSKLDMSNERVKIIVPNKPLDSKINSISLAFDSFEYKHDAMVILDNDNLISSNYLSRLNHNFNKGHKVVQTNLRPKNLDGLYSRLDAASNLFGNFIDRHFRSAFNLSSNIYGLGIAIEIELYKSIVYGQLVGGFDKKLQAQLAEKEFIAYDTEALVYDEKVTKGEVLRTQRTRWLNSYFIFVKYAFELMIFAIKKGSFNKFYFALNTIRPPWVVLGLLSVTFMTINFILNPILVIPWIFAFASFGLSFVIILKIEKADKSILKALPQIPMFIFWQLLALAQMKKANKSFMHTRHDKVMTIDDIPS